jgi:hypothetical protein
LEQVYLKREEYWMAQEYRWWTGSHCWALGVEPKKKKEWGEYLTMVEVEAVEAVGNWREADCWRELA